MQGEYQHIERNVSHSVKLNTKYIYIKQPYVKYVKQISGVCNITT